MATKKRKEKPEQIKKLLKDIGTDANEIGRSIVLEQCEKAGLTVPRVLKEIADGLNAEEIKVAYSAQEGSWQYSKKLKAWPIRQKAVDQAIAILGVKAPEKIDSKITGNSATTVIVDFGTAPKEDE